MAISKTGLNFQDIIMRLHQYWAKQGCLIWNAHHEMVGAGTFNSSTLLRVLGPEPWNVCYVEPSFRPDDGRFAENPNRMQMHHQYQVILQPPPIDPQELYLGSLYELGIKRDEHDIRFVEDNWESPALSAWGLGWEVWLDGMEVTQFTYFQQAGGVPLDPPACELTYGLERLAMYIQNVNSVWDLRWNDTVLYADILKRQEIEFCEYDFNAASVERASKMFEIFEQEAKLCIDKGLPTPALDYVLRCSHSFNILDARGAVGLSERVKFFGRMRDLTRQLAELFVKSREDAGLPLLKNSPPKVEVQLPKIESKISEPTTFALEIGVEELAAFAPGLLVTQIKENFPKLLTEARLTFEDVYVSATPRRIGVVVKGLSPRQPDLLRLVRGPTREAAAKNPAALLGFCKKNGISPEQVVYEIENGIEYAVAKIDSKGQATVQVLATIVPALIAGLKCESTMRWLGSEQYGDSAKLAFNRPIRWVLALFGSEVVPFQVAGVVSGREIRGGRWTGSHVISVPHADKYIAVLSAAGVVLDTAQRLETIRAQVEAAAKTVHGTARITEGVLAEVAQLVEHPTAFVCNFEARFIELPAEVIVSTMEKHVRCFSVFDAEQKIMPFFIGVRNGTAEHIKIVQQGYERLIGARFSDAAFFIDRDSTKKLEAFRENIKKLVFHAKVGSMFDKTERLVQLVDLLLDGPLVMEADRAALKRAALLSKADLGTQMVTEMTSLQGEMGRNYALKSGESAAVATALYEQYLPKNAGGAAPKTPLGLALGILDRVDTIAALFSVGVEPTGSADPFGLRREALSLITALIETKTQLSVGGAFGVALKVLGKGASDGVADRALDFVGKRLEVVLRDRGFRHDAVKAVLARVKDSPYRALQVVTELQALLVQTDGAEADKFRRATQAVLRCQKIIDFAHKKKIVVPTEVNQALLRDAEERTLVAELDAAAKELKMLRGAGITARYVLLGKLVLAITAFFEKVMVMVDEAAVRDNRLAIAAQVTMMVEDLVDLRELEGFKAE